MRRGRRRIVIIHLWFAELTLINPVIFISDIGIRSPNHHLADVRWVFCSSNESSDATVTPAQQRDLLKLQCLGYTAEITTCTAKGTKSVMIQINTGAGSGESISNKRKTLESST
jgi:hypothetical protein